MLLSHVFMQSFFLSLTLLSKCLTYALGGMFVSEFFNLCVCQTFYFILLLNLITALGFTKLMTSLRKYFKIDCLIT